MHKDIKTVLIIQPRIINTVFVISYANGSNEPDDSDFSLLLHSFAKTVIGVSAENGLLPSPLK